MKEIEIEGKSVEEAIDKALTQLHATLEEVDIKIVNEGKAGLFGLMGAVPARVKVMLKESQSYEQNDQFSTTVKSLVDKLIGKMQLDGESQIIMKEGTVYVSIDSLDSALLIGKKGQTLDAFQHISNLIINKWIKAGKIGEIAYGDKNRVVIDTEGYRSRRDAAIVANALKIAAQVKETGRKERLSPMSSHERKVIHVALEKISGISTQSEGEGEQRSIVIYPSPRRSNP